MVKDVLNIAMVCFPSFGGSGVLATELALALARRGHRVHLLSSRRPFRLDEHPRLRFHPIEVHDYPLFEHAPFTMALASQLALLSEQESIDVLHLHYAIPFAASALLMKQILGTKAPKVVTTLHGTDVTHLGHLPHHLPVLQTALRQSDGITTPSQYLRKAAYTHLKLSPDTTPIQVIPNFVDSHHFRPADEDTIAPAHPFFQSSEDKTHSPILVHLSNFRPVKRPIDVIDIFAKIRSQRPARLLMIGDGPEREHVALHARQLGVDEDVSFIGSQREFVSYLQRCDLMLLPSEMESFGLAALEAMSCGVPVLASHVGGLPELIEHGVSGYLADVGDIEAMAALALQHFDTPQQMDAMRQAARRVVEAKWSTSHIIQQYEEAYLRLCSPSYSLSQAEQPSDAQVQTYVHHKE